MSLPFPSQPSTSDCRISLLDSRIYYNEEHFLRVASAIAAQYTILNGTPPSDHKEMICLLKKFSGNNRATVDEFLKAHGQNGFCYIECKEGYCIYIVQGFPRNGRIEYLLADFTGGVRWVSSEVLPKCIYE